METFCTHLSSVNISSFVMRINQLLTHSNLTNTIYRLQIIVVLIQVTGRKEWVTLDQKYSLSFDESFKPSSIQNTCLARTFSRH